MRKLFALGLGLLFLGSCNKVGDFELNFKPLMKGEPLVLNQSYPFGELNLKFENLAFYLSDLSLVNDDGEEVALTDIEFISLNAFDLSSAQSGQVLSYLEIPADNYTKLKFSIGVPEDLNKQTPEDFNVSDPLGKTDYYWGPWASYIFSKTEGNADTNGDGDFDLKYFYHTGSDALFRFFELEQDIVITNKNTKRLELYLDYDDLLRNEDGSYFDIATFPRNHNPEDLDIITQLVDNYARAIKIKE